ncbi:glucosamine-6-phosphate deaminase [Metabacillus endolithicus]|uniref:Glucosamine-6-phosphate deaminase n=1 Tax=Metabacillus endolithicus TaxID=1535204 RepID=A0ABW5C363_9BACI|nr:glucosamine-6-phosphate deaminase [Metabacillus endolithicus]UPG62316.1 glucosamine-6-phosphate deaminase [Metabacillus endolithicus]
MKVIEVISYDEMSELAARYFLTKITTYPRLTLGLATGSSPKGIYQYLVHDYDKNRTDYSHITTFNLDEYIGLSKDHQNSYYQYMHDNLFHHVNIPPKQIHIPSGINDNNQAECEVYEEKINAIGGIDLQLLGIGANGHIGFNEPGTPFYSKTHVVNLTASTREANMRFFNNICEVPSQAITMGIQTIFNSKEIILLASGQTKQHAMVQLLSGEVSESFPASILNKHPNITVIADEEALLLAKEIGLR